MRKLQIGVIGTFADKEVPPRLNELARQVGAEIAKNGHVLVFGPELDGDSISTQAALGAKEANGTTVGILYGSSGLQKILDDDVNKLNKQRVKEAADFVIWTGAERGGPRESVLVLSCDGLIAISGGSGTLTEMMIAYMNRRPVVVLENTGGWADKMANQFFDHRQRAKAIGAKTPEEAVKLIINQINLKNSAK